MLLPIERYWVGLVLNQSENEFQWQYLSVGPDNFATYCMLTRHATTEYGNCIKIAIRFRLSHKLRGQASIERVAA